MTTRALVLASCIVLLAASAAGQVVTPDRGSAGSMRESVFGLGFAAGPASGLGLSFRHHLPSILSYEINGGVIKVDDRMLYDIGAELQLDLSRSGSTRFFAAGAFSYFYAGSANHNEMSAPERVGLGLGGEMHSSAGFHVTLELLFTYFADATVLPLPQFGVHYYF
jgi:hypothetical protein